MCVASNKVRKFIIFLKVKKIHQNSFNIACNVPTLEYEAFSYSAVIHNRGNKPPLFCIVTESNNGKKCDDE